MCGSAQSTEFAPKAEHQESLGIHQVEEMQKLKDQIFYLQQENHKLEQTIQVTMKSEYVRMTNERDRLEDDKRRLTDDVKRLEYQVQRIIGKPLDPIEKREEGEMYKEQKIQQLE